MRPENSVWQGNFGYWQNEFIHANLLVIGYYAWNGYVESGRGMVCVDVQDAAIASKIISLDWIPFRAEFIAKPQVVSQMQAHKQAHKFEEGVIDQLLRLVDRYHPDEDVILLLTAQTQTEIHLLHNLKISPPECDRQVRRRWHEFQPCFR